MNSVTEDRLLGRTEYRSSRSNKSPKCSGRLGSLRPAALMASLNLAGWAVASVTIGEVVFSEQSLPDLTPTAVCGSTNIEFFVNSSLIN